MLRFLKTFRITNLLKESLIDTKQLYKYINENETRHSIRLLDCTFYLPSHGKNIKDEFEKERIPGSVLFDIEEIRDKSSKLPHMIIPDEKEFIEHMKRLDIRKNDIIVCYDR